MRPRLLIATGEEMASGQARTLDARQSHHLVRVLRITPGAALECFDGAGARFEAHVERADPRACLIRLGARVEADTESALRITLVQCLGSADRMDWAIEKAVELGVHAIQPLESERSPVRLDAARAQRRHQHWSRIVAAACMQCGRDRLPALGPVLAFDRWIGDPDRSGAATRIVLDPQAPTPLSQLHPEPSRPIELRVGPQSGWAATELHAAGLAGFCAARLGPRVLRAETAGLAAIAALQALAGDF
ncbi:MAG: 16S rRNA (uracil(1498)-N(3))-methyltransferase [Burkholderiaceae bacterium]|nr:16S rRNA (uracil(1498)-N(3))-methyltransferase [Burkholderiaceae bacterium]